MDLAAMEAATADAEDGSGSEYKGEECDSNDEDYDE
jgi:hypothetical protein